MALVLFSIGLLGATETAHADDSTSTDPRYAVSPESIGERLAVAQQELAAIDSDERQENLEHRLEDRAAIAALTALLTRQLEIAGQLETPLEPAAESDLDSEPPSVFALGAVEAERRRRRERAAQLRDELADAQESLDSARSAAREADRTRRQMSAEVGSDDQMSDPRIKAPLWSSRIADEELNLRTLELRAIRRAIEHAESTTELDRRAASIRERLRNGEGSSNRGLNELLATEAELRREQESLERRLATLELRIASTSNRYTKAPLDQKESLLAVVDSLNAQRTLLRHALTLAEARVGRVNGRKELWEIWQRRLVRPKDGDHFAADANRVRNRIDELEQARQRIQISLEGRDRSLRGLEDRRDSSPPGSELRTAIVAQHDALSALRTAESTALRDIAEDLGLAANVRDELGGRPVTGPAELLADVREGARRVWRYEIAAVQDSSITLGSILIALLVLLSGAWFSKRLSVSVGDFTERRFKLDPGAAASIQTLIFYLLLVSFALFALRILHFPLTAFTVLGGALAIGLGFGSQNVMNNFISGLILMLERPVRVHDTIEVDGDFGSVERIGARSTQIRATDGRHIVVPNSFFLESNVVNWTLSDDLIRTSVVVGVVYGSPTRLVDELIRQVVDEIEEVLSHPEPIILFDDFGDNALTFEVLFWISARRPLQTRRVASQVRFRIDDLFRENGLVIAFPQRDVHLDTVRPLEVKVVDDASTEG